MASGLPTSPTTRRTHERLVAATRAEIAATGSFTAERVAARAESSPATFYSYFPSKADALAAAFESVMQDLIAFTERELSIERLLDVGLEARCAELVAATARFFTEHERIFDHARAALPESPQLRDIYRRCEATARDIYRQFVERAQRAGQVRPGDAEAVARGLLVLMQGLNNPLVTRCKPRDPLRRELGTALFAYLAPDATSR